MKEIQTNKTVYRVSDFISWQRDGTLELNPNFQRRPVWKPGAKSYLIDTILRGLPMPIIFLRDLRSDLKTFKSKRDVVDGQQRIRTVLSFIAPESLNDYDASRDDFKISRVHSKEYAGRRFSDLPQAAQQRILDYTFSVHSFSADTDDREILQIFARMNSTGVKLNEQELRNAEYYGSFKQLSYELATEQLNRWREWKIFTPNQIARMYEVEFTSELMIIMLQGIGSKSKPNIDSFYKSYDDDFPDSDEVSRRFRDILDTIENSYEPKTVTELFGSRSLFYALFATIYGLRYSLRSAFVSTERLNRERGKPITMAAIDAMQAAARAIHSGRDVPQLVAQSLRGATSDAASRREIIKYFAGEDNDPCPQQS
ncbi:DUF262 domain-containing protein [Methylorubrum podarium]|uniref:DUF262 domain-containing protein n=1 Tax=Methylorubrum podarium TaxID=200476 RepID=A0ABV1QV48_9HYPH